MDHRLVEGGGLQAVHYSGRFPYITNGSLKPSFLVTVAVNNSDSLRGILVDTIFGWPPKLS